MADVVARSHGGDGGNSPPRGPSRRIGTNCQRSKSKAANPNAKIGKGGKVVRGATKNTALKAKVAQDRRPVSIDFRVNQEGFYTHVGRHAAWFSNYVGELLRDSIPMFCDSWAKVPETAKAHIHDQLHHYFDLDPHIAGPNGDKVVDSIEYYL